MPTERMHIEEVPGFLVKHGAINKDAAAMLITTLNDGERTYPIYYIRQLNGVIISLQPSGMYTITVFESEKPKLSTLKSIW